MEFCKYHGAGNDFILIDSRAGSFTSDSGYIAHLCHRRFGIGADGLMLLEMDADADFYMRYFNADGSEGTMCGNGGRCIAAFARRLGVVTDKVRFNSSDGMHLASIDYHDSTSVVKLKMCDVNGVQEEDGYYFINTGSPHYVRFIDRLADFDVVGEGKKIRHSPLFAPKGTNVNFVEKRGSELLIGTFERGVEDETLACGTGATAAAIAASIHFTDDSRASYQLKAKGGDLKVSFEKVLNGVYRNIWLEGPATFVFKGQLD